MNLERIYDALETADDPLGRLDACAAEIREIEGMIDDLELELTDCETCSLSDAALFVFESEVPREASTRRTSIAQHNAYVERSNAWTRGRAYIPEEWHDAYDALRTGAHAATPAARLAEVDRAMLAKYEGTPEQRALIREYLLLRSAAEGAVVPFFSDSHLTDPIRPELGRRSCIWAIGYEAGVWLAERAPVDGHVEAGWALGRRALPETLVAEYDAMCAESRGRSLEAVLAEYRARLSAPYRGSEEDGIYIMAYAMLSVAAGDVPVSPFDATREDLEALSSTTDVPRMDGRLLRSEAVEYEVLRGAREAAGLPGPLRGVEWAAARAPSPERVDQIRRLFAAFEAETDELDEIKRLIRVSLGLG